MSRILVTGASGFVGRAVIAAFAEQGHVVRAGVRRPPQPRFPAGVEIVQHPDFSQPIDWRPVLHGVEKVIHLAGIAHTSGVAPDVYDLINHAATARLASAAAQAGVSHLVFVSSIQAQCGPTADHVLTESDPAAPTNAYGSSKLAAEQAVSGAGVPSTILRPVLLYGPGVKGNFALLLRAAGSRWPLPAKGFNNRRSLLGIDNFIAALAFVLSSPDAIGQTYVVADPGVPPRLSDLIATLREAQGRRPLLVPVSPAYFETTLRILGRSDLWDRLGGSLRVDAGKLLAAGWRPPHDTRAGLIALVRSVAPQSTVAGPPRS